MDKKKKPKRKAKWLNDDYVPLFIRIPQKYPDLPLWLSIISGVVAIVAMVYSIIYK